MTPATDPAQLRALLVLSSVVEARDAYTGGHLWRVSQVARRLAEQAGLSRHEVFRAAVGGFLHDLGKVAMPDSILQKATRLDEEEYRVIKTHPDVGRGLLREHPLGHLAIDAVTYHHERHDGGGYPEGLSGETIPLMARIVALSDCFDAMTSVRPYRTGMTVDAAVERMAAERGRQFNPLLLDCFLQVARTDALHHIAGHSDVGIPLGVCPWCGPIIAIPRSVEDDAAVYCRACSAEFRTRWGKNGCQLEFTERHGTPEQLRHEADMGVINQVVELAP